MLPGEERSGSNTLISIGDTVDVTDLVAIVGWNGHLGDCIATSQKLQDDLRVEVPAIRQAVEVKRAECLTGIGAVTRVEFGEMCAEQPVLDFGEDAVANILVARHVPL